MGEAILFALACNLDTVLLAAAFSLRGVSLSLGGKLVLAAVTTAVTAIFLVLGQTLHGLLPGSGTAPGGVALIGLGCWVLLDGLRGKSGTEEFSDKNSTTRWGVVQLAAALAVNNAGVGAAAGATGLSVLWGCVANFGVTLLCLPIGRLLANCRVGRRIQPYALPLSGILLVALGAAAL